MNTYKTDLLDLRCMDCMELMREMPDNSVDSIVTDPPYGLSFMGKKWDHDVPAVEIWAECLRVLKPGGHLLAFAGTRTQHRMAVRIEDAGFEIRDMIAWVYGSGFPKSHNLDGEWTGWGTALKPALEPITVARKPFKGTVAANVQEYGTGAINIDATRIRTADQERDADACRRLSFLCSSVGVGDVPPEQIRDSLMHVAFELRSCSTVDTDRSRNEGDLDGSLLDRVLCERLVARLFPNGVWCGGSSWSVPDSLCGCPVCRRSCDVHTRLLRDAAQDGPASLADALAGICSGQCGLEHSRYCQCSDHPSSYDDSLLAWSFSFVVGEYTTLYSYTPQSQGRWPANLIHDGSEEVLAGFPHTKSGAIRAEVQASSLGRKGIYGKGNGGEGRDYTASEGSAARFFYCAKASKADRNEGCEGMDEKHVRRDDGQPYGMNTNTHRPDGSERKPVPPRANNHPTVKPTDLMRYLCRLVTPPGGVVLDPFMGSGSTGKAAMLEGFRFVGAEMQPEYFEIAKARIEYGLTRKEREYSKEDSQMELPL